MLAPDRDSPEYESYLADKISEEEERLKMLKDKCRVTQMEEQLARLRLQTFELGKKPSADDDHQLSPGHDSGVASKLLSAATRGTAGGSPVTRTVSPA